MASTSLNSVLPRPSGRDVNDGPPSAGVRPAQSLASAERRRLASLLRANRGAILDDWWGVQFAKSRLEQFGIEFARDATPDSLRASFLRPLLDLLIAYIETGEDRYRDVYLNERLRFAPRRKDFDERNRYFTEVLAPDEASILKATARSSSSDALASMLQELHEPLYFNQRDTPLRILALGDCLMGEVSTSLMSTCRRERITLDFRQLYFSALMGKEVSLDQILKFLETFPADLIALSFLSYEGIPLYSSLMKEADRSTEAVIADRVTGIIALMRSFLERLREHTEAPFLLHNVSGLPLTRFRKRLPFVPALSAGRRRAVRLLNESIAALAENTPKVIVIDESEVVGRYGLRTCSAALIPSSIGRKAVFHTSRFSSYLTEPYFELVQAFRTLRKAKVLLVDFDNTLWDGVMADGPVTQNRELQLLLRRLKEAGILLVAVSKNDPQNLRWDEITLQPDDFALLKISWNLKVQSIRETADQLNLGLDSFVLIDDNPVERELVRNELPTVQTLDPTSDSTQRWLNWMMRFPNTRDTEEARTRTQLYREQAQRREALSQSCDYPAMMASLKLQVVFGKMVPEELDRVSELIQRTNQFNTTTIRYSKKELSDLQRSDRHSIYVVSLSDKFGSTGLVCVIIVERRDADRIVDSFVMSCRAMGFELERLMLRLVLDAEATGAQRFVGRIIETSRNTPSQRVFAAHGFEESGGNEWSLAVSAPRPELPAWFSITSRDG